MTSSELDAITGRLTQMEARMTEVQNELNRVVILVDGDKKYNVRGITSAVDDMAQRINEHSGRIDAISAENTRRLDALSAELAQTKRDLRLWLGIAALAAAAGQPVIEVALKLIGL